LLFGTKLMKYFAVDAESVGGDFQNHDCIYAARPPAGQRDREVLHQLVPNSMEFQLRFSVPIPRHRARLGVLQHYAKTTQSPSASPASNRKARTACFIVGGALRVEKRAGSADGPLLGGASFSVVSRRSHRAPTIITGLSNPSHTTPTHVSRRVCRRRHRRGHGPSGTHCIVDGDRRPAGYLVRSDATRSRRPRSSSQTVNVFVNHQLGSLSVSKHAVGGSGTFHFTSRVTPATRTRRST